MDELPLNQDAPATTVGNCIFSFDWVCNAFLGRVINLADNYCDALNRKEALVAATLCRALLESIAHFHHLLYKISNYLKIKQYGRTYSILAQYMLGGDHGFEKERKKLGKIHISTSMESIDKTYEVVSKTYNWLCEFVHPNSLGAVLMFSHLNKQDQKVHFYQKPVFESSLSPAFEGAIYLPIFCEDWKESAEIKLQLQREWKPTIEVCDLF